MAHQMIAAHKHDGYVSGPNHFEIFPVFLFPERGDTAITEFLRGAITIPRHIINEV